MPDQRVTHGRRSRCLCQRQKSALTLPKELDLLGGHYIFDGLTRHNFTEPHFRRRRSRCLRRGEMPLLRVDGRDVAEAGRGQYDAQPLTSVGCEHLVAVLRARNYLVQRHTLFQLRRRQR